MAEGIQSFKDLLVWKKAMALSVLCYELTKAFPKDEMYGMTAQIRRASVSVPANIAEGHGREHTQSFVQFFGSRRVRSRSSKRTLCSRSRFS